jgi:hypothetical protein
MSEDGQIADRWRIYQIDPSLEGGRNRQVVNGHCNNDDIGILQLGN